MSELAKALLAFQKEAPALHKSSEGQVGTRKYKYLGLDDAMGVIRPALNKHGVVVMQRLTYSDGSRAVSTELLHAESGESMHSGIVLPATDDMQALGSAITYARRYSLIAMLGLVADEDDDGSRANTQNRQENGPPPKPEFPKEPGYENKPASEQPADKAQIKVLSEALAALEQGFPHPTPDWTWTKEAQHYCKDTWGKDSVSMLSKTQTNELIAWAEAQLLEQTQVAEVPFG